MGTRSELEGAREKGWKEARGQEGDEESLIIKTVKEKTSEREAERPLSRSARYILASSR